MSREDVARLEEKLTALDRLTDAKFVASERAIEKAEHATERRFEGVNGFRAQLADQVAQFVSRETFEAQLSNVEHAAAANAESNRARISVLEKIIERQQGRGAGLAAGWGYIVTAFGLTLTIATLVIIFTR